MPALFLRPALIAVVAERCPLRLCLIDEDARRPIDLDLGQPAMP
jgi:hypothetical protein